MSDAPKETAHATKVVVDPDALALVLEEARSRQSLGKGFAGGLVAAAVGAAAWALVTVLTKYQIGYMAIGVGALVGLGVRALGKGIDPPFAWTGAILALAGCIAGNFLAVCGFVARETGEPFFTVASALSGEVVDVMKKTFQPMDALFYALAVYAAFRLSRRNLTPDEVRRATKRVPAEEDRAAAAP